MISISDSPEDDNEGDRSSISSTTGSPFTVTNAKDSGVEVTITLSGTDSAGKACTTDTVKFTTTNN